MCSWCYGFGPELAALLEGLPGMPIHIVLGGLRAYNRQPMDEELKNTLLTHWEHVRQRTGLPFSPDVLSSAGFVYDTEPACRAVVAARTIAPDAGFAVFRAIQHAFYGQGLDVTRREVLAATAVATLTEAGFPTSAEDFLAVWHAETTVAATRGDFEQSKRWGVSGFPTLVLEREGRLDLVTAGYVPMPTLVERMQALVDRDAPANGGTAA